MVNQETDTDAFLPLESMPERVKFYSTTSVERLGCGSAIYEDRDEDDMVSAGDRRVNHVRLSIGGVVIDYPPESIVAEGDADVGLPLYSMTQERYFDANQDGIFSYGDFIYWDADNNFQVSNGDIRLTEVNYRGKTYMCGSQIILGDVWTHENPVTGITMGRNGDFRCMDIVVLPGHSRVQARVHPPLRVEQTSTIQVQLPSPPRPGEKAYIVLRTPTGNDFIREIKGNQTMHTFTYTPYEGTCSALGIHEPLMLEIYRDLEKQSTGNQPSDGKYGHWNISTNASLDIMRNQYDCKMIDVLKVIPEEIYGRLNVTCLRNVGSRFPNLIIKLMNADNPDDVNDPAHMAISSLPERNIVANYNATGAGIDYFFTAKDAMGNRYIVQVNRDASYLVWKWKDNPSPTPGRGMVGVLDLEDEVIGPFSSINGIPLTNGRFEDKDCSDSQRECSACTTGRLPPMGRITKGDTFGIFDGTFGWIETDGVPVFVTAHGHGLIGGDGGEIPIAVIPRDTSSDLMVRVFTHNAVYDYNSTIRHPPYFITNESPGINYCGIIPIGWQSSDPPPSPPPPDDPPPPSPPPPGGGGNVVFSEMVVVDHALRLSKVPYTQNIRPDYDPVLRHLIRDFRPYPGGQTHTGRAGTHQREGRNAYPAQWENMFVKLGTEFFPMSDYGIFFVLRDARDGGLVHFEAQDRSKRIARIDIRGPFKVPHFPLSGTTFGGLRNVPITYDYSGHITIDSGNYKDYELTGADWTNVINPGKREQVRYSDPSNSYLSFSRRLNYQGIPRVIVIDELIPIANGRISIEVTTADGRRSVLVDCCDVPVEGIPVQGLEFSNLTGGIELGQDSQFSVTVKEYTTIQNVRYANDALVFIWQDRGVRSAHGGHLIGAGDGWVTGAPESSVGTGRSTAYSPRDDLNGDGKISFNDWETEIIGTYDLATNTWFGGVIDARTFQVNNGVYTFRLSKEHGNVVDTVGIDFNENNIIDTNEILPVLLTAYKYGDDNNDRAFTPLYPSPIDNKMFSHEVYLAGQTIIPIGFSSGPANDLVVTTEPSSLVAGVSPEQVFNGDPFTVIVKREDGSPVDLTRNGALSVRETAALFFDDRPQTLPDYYWLRTDLQNVSNDFASNEKLFGASNLIQYDFSQARQGIYRFRNFVANDAGSFRLRVLTHDRRSFGSTEVKIEHPSIHYTVYDMEGEKVQYPVVGGMYKIKAQLQHHDGKNKMGQGLHFMPYLTDGLTSDKDTVSGYFGYTLQPELKPEDIFSVDQSYVTLFNKDKRRLNQSDWFGNGCIYNHPYQGYYWLSDRNSDGKVDHRDAFKTSNGTVEFYMPVTHAWQVGSLIGWNNLITDPGLSDVAGARPEDHGNTLQRRFRSDGVFHTDWFGFSPKTIQFHQAVIEVKDRDGSALSNDFYNFDNPDLILGKQHELMFILDESAPYLKGLAFYEQDTLLKTVMTEGDERTLMVDLTPGNPGEAVIEVRGILDFDPWIKDPIETLDSLLMMDVVQTANLEILQGHYLYTDLRSEIVVQATDYTGEPIRNDTLIIQGSQNEWKKELDSQGRASLRIIPEVAENLSLTLEKTYVPYAQVIRVWDSNLPPAIELDEYPLVTSEKEWSFTGWTWPGAHLTANDQSVEVGLDGKFSAKISLVEGKQEIVFRSTHPRGRSATVKIDIEAVWTGPVLKVDPFPDDLVDIETYTVTGSVEPYDAQVFVNDERAEVMEGKFSAEIRVEPGVNSINIRAVNAFGHESSAVFELKIYEQTVIVLTIGRMSMMVNGKTITLDAEPFIRHSRTMVPVRAVAEAFGAVVNWESRSETVEIELEGLFISMQIGNPVAMVGNRVFRLDSPPVIHRNRTFVPIRFIAEAFGSIVEWDAENEVVTIERLTLPQS